MKSVQQQLFELAEAGLGEGRPLWVSIDHVPGEWHRVTSIARSRGGSFIQMRAAADGDLIVCRFKDLAAVRFDEEQRASA
ncbi:hypothetical protein [Sphingosinicella sp. BN140058]|uniref:hypothetical protein n=1 Tax=Sphingosinicella sp. BN140058 TaxID=1892855 RepID=UPI0010108FE0|nr:hypothetical protein [Sphingosinicella sp. BN140058]QAY78600.1 hypothetical protein ETR14_20190 [Sphingosinicella sp. BN140058]